MDISPFEGWSAKIAAVADHTYVKCPGTGDRYFECWGGHGSPGQEQRTICKGPGSYQVADCYRMPALGKPDTAGVVPYAVDGVCHQSANRFLHSASVTLNLHVRGYWLSVLNYGQYGRTAPIFLLEIYKKCGGSRAIEQPGGEHGELIDATRDLYLAAQRQKVRPPTNALLADETAEVTRFFAPGIDPADFRDLQLAHLETKDAIVAAGVRGAPLAERLDALGRETQQQLADRLGAEDYERLMGVPPGQWPGLVDPALADLAGEPAPRG